MITPPAGWHKVNAQTIRHDSVPAFITECGAAFLASVNGQWITGEVWKAALEFETVEAAVQAVMQKLN